MLNDDGTNQMTLFQVRAPVTEEKTTEPPSPAEKPPTKLPAVKKPATRKKTSVQIKSSKPEPARGVSGQVPDGDVRLTANIREDLHLKLKIAAARRRTTIGELIEEFVETYL